MTRTIRRAVLLLVASASTAAAAPRALVRLPGVPLTSVTAPTLVIGSAHLIGPTQGLGTILTPVPLLSMSLIPAAAVPAPVVAVPVTAAASSDAPAPAARPGKAALDALATELTSAASDSGNAGDALGRSFDGAVPGAKSAAVSEPVHHIEAESGSLSIVPRRHDARKDETVGFRIPPELLDLLPSARQRNPKAWTNRVSFHLHSVYSDGTLQPEDVVAAAVAKGVKVLSLTDHDTVAGIARARAKAKELGVTFHAGVEMSAGGGVHVNAIGVDETNPQLIALLERVRIQRLVRAQTIVEHLNARFENSSDPRERAVRMTLEEVKAKSMHDEGGTIEIPHVARVLIDKGLIKNVQEAYRTYLTGKVLTDPRVPESPDVEEVLAAVHAAGGKAFLNHPYTVRGENQAERDAKVKTLLAKGMDGIEVYRHSRARSESGKRALDSRVAKYLGWALGLGLIIGNGADYHGPGTGLSSLIVWMPKTLASKLEKAFGGARRGRGRRTAAGPRT
ncbi:MAG TPA: hypothetical protein DCZ01_02285 [Elusimicrobia bacterium]|nr:hypothetical protein [Elusimicrobiota bacterium]